MDIVDQIIKDVRSNKPLKTITANISSDQLSLAESIYLLEKAKQFWNSEPDTAYSLLQVLYSLSRDDWFRLKIITYAVQHPNCKKDSMQNTLRTMQRMIITLKPTDHEQIMLHQNSQAIYYYLNGNMFHKAGDDQQAVESWRTSVALFNILKKETQVKYIQDQIDRLSQKLPEVGTQKQSQIDNDIPKDRKTPTIREAEMHLSTLEANIIEKRDQLDKLSQKQDSIETLISQLESNLKFVNSKLLSLEKRIDEKKGEFDQINLETQQAKIELEKTRGELERILVEKSEHQTILEQMKTNSNQTLILSSDEELENTRNELLRAQQKVKTLENQLAEHKNKTLPGWVSSVVNRG